MRRLLPGVDVESYHPDGIDLGTAAYPATKKWVEGVSRNPAGETKEPAALARRRHRLRAQGLRMIQIWVPDTRRPEFASEARGQAARSSAPYADDDDVNGSQSRRRGTLGLISRWISASVLTTASLPAAATGLTW